MLLRNNALISNPALVRFPENALLWDTFIKTLNDQTVDSLTIQEYLRIGDPAPDYDDGTGLWLGMDGGVAKFFVGDSSGNKITWDGADLTVIPTVHTFTPGFIGFSSAISTTMSYISFGAYAILWTETGFSENLGAVTSWSITGLPADIQPSANKYARTVAIDDGTRVAALGEIVSSGAIVMYTEFPDTNVVRFLSGGWTVSSECGLPAGATFIYPTG